MSDTLGVGMWSNERVLVGILKFMKETRSGQSMVEFSMLWISLRSVLRKIVSRLLIEREDKTASEGRLRRLGTLFLTMCMKKLVICCRDLTLVGADIDHIGEQ